MPPDRDLRWAGTSPPDPRFVQGDYPRYRPDSATFTIDLQWNFLRYCQLGNRIDVMPNKAIFLMAAMIYSALFACIQSFIDHGLKLNFRSH